MEQVTHMRRNRARVAGLLICLLSAFAAYSQSASQASESPVEYQVKAAFLLNFTKFIDWPAGVVREPGFADHDLYPGQRSVRARAG